MRCDAAPTGFLAPMPTTDHRFLLFLCMWNLKSIGRTIDLNETDSLLDNIVTQLGAVLSLKHTHQTIKAWELEKGVAPFP